MKCETELKPAVEELQKILDGPSRKIKIKEDGSLTTEEIHNLPWWRKDKFNWPIETYIGQPIRSFVRIIFQNIRKVTG